MATSGRQEASFVRFGDIPEVIDIPVGGGDGEGDEVVTLDLNALGDETDELCDLLQTEKAARSYWTTIALSYAKQGNVDVAIDMLQKGLAAQGRSDDRLGIITCLCWLYLWKCRQAPRVADNGDRTKDYWLSQATTTLNDASRINPQHPPLFLAKGTLHLLRASMQPGKVSGGAGGGGDKAETLRQAAKCFDDALKASNGRNVMAMIGKARVQYSLGRYGDALGLYQKTLAAAPGLVSPDPRIGIGCCLWQLRHKEPARAAWQRALDVNPESAVANALLGLFYLDSSNKYSPTDVKFFSPLYKKAMTVHTQAAYRQDDTLALANATFGQYYLLRKMWDRVEQLARRAIAQTDVNAVASDGWFLLARKEHFVGDLARAAEYYAKADQARGGDEAGFLPAKFGAAQLKTLMQDADGAKFGLEKVLAAGGAKSIEALTLLGILYAEDDFGGGRDGREDRSVERNKAIGLLEQVRAAWKDSRRNVSPDPVVLLNLARLYERDAPDRALACLQQVEKMELDEIADDDERLAVEGDLDSEAKLRAKRKLLSPQLLNNIGCFHFHTAAYSQALESFQTALGACVHVDAGEDVDSDALVTTISFNLGRTYEAEGLVDEAVKVYHDLLQRHPNYVDAKARVACIALDRRDPGAGDALKELLEANIGNLDVRGLYGWYLHRHKKRTPHLNEDQEQRHHKHTLQHYDKHDLYALAAMGNLHLTVAREMRRETDQDKEKRSKTYVRAVEFFDKILSLDPKNAFAAQGLAIALIEDKRDVSAGIQILSRVRESLRRTSPSVHINLGHIFAETKQWARSIENYELALQRSKHHGVIDSHLIACLGRVWLQRGRHEKKLECYKTALDLSRQALVQSPENIHFAFNVAFVQMQLAQLIISLPETERSLEEINTAASDLDDAIASFLTIAASPTPPFPRADLEARANMGKNTMKRQLTAAAERQAAYEQEHSARLEEAKRRREEQIALREEEKRKAAQAAEEERRKIKEERERIAEEDRLLMAKRLEEEKLRLKAEEEELFDSDGQPIKKKKKRRTKRKKKNDEEGEGESAVQEDSDVEPTVKPKRRRLEKKSSNKFKSAERIEDSDEEDVEMGEAETMEKGKVKPRRVLDDDDDDDEEEEEEEEEKEKEKEVGVGVGE
ncbi:TPR-like protein [Piedraia hortae CBS 480.64]|uniref:TPR-like protein n=1 Tax=Piedraia hortae CBS 480.64 TaxID=1314780 RepID=A0A6A7C566_9PEZI|nr:TPR-like protein [Piedraia hortae CBS 480.64]